jgi:hypothetical protein
MPTFSESKFTVLRMQMERVNQPKPQADEVDIGISESLSGEYSSGADDNRDSFKDFPYLARAESTQ